MGNEILIFLVIVFAFFLLEVTDTINVIPNFPKTSDDGDLGKITTSTTIKLCSSSATITIDFFDKYMQTESMKGQKAVIYVNGLKKGTFVEGETKTALLCDEDKIDIYYVLDPSQNVYYVSHASGKIPNIAGTMDFFLTSFFPKGKLSGVLQNTPEGLYKIDMRMSTTIINQDFTLNSRTQPQDFTVGKTKKVTVKLFPTFNRGYGVVDGSTLACQFTNSEWDETNSKVLLNGQTLAFAKYIPSSKLFPIISGNIAKYLKFPAVDGKITSNLDLTFSMKSTDNQPSNWDCVIFDTDIYEKDDGTVRIGIEDSDDNTNIGSKTDVKFTIFAQ